MAYNVGNKIGVSKQTGILDLYKKNVDNTAYQGFGGSQLSVQGDNATNYNCEVVGGFGADKDGSGNYNLQYVGGDHRSPNEHENFEAINRFAEKFGNPKFNDLG